MSTPKLFTIAPDAPFLSVLADRVLDGTLLSGWPQQGPFWLSDVTIVLPTRRARLALAEAFLERGQRLLPDIRTFGGEQQDEEPFLPPHDLPGLPPAASALERRLFLARLIDAWARTPVGQQILATPPNAAEILGLAESLGQLADDLTIEGGDLGRLRDDVAKPDLAANWQKSLEFLDIALKSWPQALAGRGKGDPADLRNQRLRRQAEAAPLLFADRPVIAAGSTGSIPATADLLKALTRLPRGVVVLPGLDTSLTPAAHAALLDDAGAPHGHPQHGLARLLRRLGAAPAGARELSQVGSPRLQVVRTALSLPADTAAWAQARRSLEPVLAAATEGITVLAAPSADMEARAIAIAARAALAATRTVGIVSPDQTLSRRIAAELLRFGVVVDDAAGTPLFQSPAGRLARLALAVAASDGEAVALMSLLHNRETTLGLERSALAQAAQLIDLGLLRGQPPIRGIAGLRAVLAANVEGRIERPARRLSRAEAELIGPVLDRLETALGPLRALFGRRALTAGDLAAALGTTLADLAPASTAPGMEPLRAWVRDLAALDDAGPAMAPVALDGILAALMAGSKVTNPAPARSDIAIWGRLEARLMAPDLMILAGLNEDIWPEAADPGPWLSRGMRLAAGLEPPERQQGQAAHDFEMALGNGAVILAWSARRGTAPALPSRLLQRLEAFVGEAWSGPMRAPGAPGRAPARRVAARARAPGAARPPAPAPIRDKRPIKLSVTEIESLFRSPYDIYARHVLHLRKLAPLGEVPDARERGSMIHAVFDAFVSGGHDFAAPGAQARLMGMAEAAFSGLDAIGERRDIWLKRFERAAAEFLAWERARSPLVRRRHAEILGRWQLPGGFVLSGKADRIDELVDGGIEIIDFKTGSIPTAKAMKAFDAPQLLLEAAMARAGAFPAVEAAEASALTYIKIGLGPDALVATPFRPRDGIGLPEAADEAGRRLQSLVDALLLGDVPMAARIRPDTARRYGGDYDHLARTDEWTIAAGEDE